MKFYAFYLACSINSKNNQNECVFIPSDCLDSVLAGNSYNSSKKPKKRAKNGLTIICLLIFLSSCAQFPHLVKNGKEYVRLSQLELTNKEKFKLDWMTDYKSEWAIVDPQFGGFIYDSSFPYDSLLNR